VVHGDNRYTYKELQGRIFRLANALKKQGIQKGDKVAFLSPNIPPMLEAHYAVPMIGAALVTINIRLSPGEVSYIVNHCDAKMVFVDNEFSGLIKPGELDKVKAYVNICDRDDTAPLDGVTYEEFLAQSDPTPMSPDVDDEDQVISINYTSGTTGRPKGVMYHHRGAYLNAVGEVLEAGLDISSVYLWTLPMFHCNGWCFTWGVTAVGGTHICLRNVVITHTYGLTEVFGPHSVCAWQPDWESLPREEQAIKKSRQGVPYIVTHFMDVVDPQTMEPVPRDGKTIGEIVMRGNNVMLGYYKDEEATREAFEGGWFHSGDLAVIHPDTYVQIMDRKKDIIISGGENISTVEVESVIYRHPDVMEVAVIPVPDEKWGEVPKAFIVPKPGASHF